MSGIINEDELMEKMKAKQDERINNLKAALVEKIKLAEAGNQKGTTFLLLENLQLQPIAIPYHINVI